MPLIILPRMIEIPVAGCDPVVIADEDMASDKAWYRLSMKKDFMLQREDFVNDDSFWRYFLVTTGLLQYPLVIIYAKEGEGKSLGMAFLVHKITTLFNKRSTLDWSPPNPKLFPNRFNLYDEDFTEKIVDELNRLKKFGNEVPESELEKLIIYNTVFGLDECDGYGDIQSQTNLVKLIGRIARRRRHFHTGIFMCYVDPNDVPRRIIFDRRSHEITCAKDAVYKGFITYMVNNRYTKVVKYFHLDPADCADAGLWNSHNLVSVSHDVDIHFGNKKKKKTNEEGEY